MNLATARAQYQRACQRALPRLVALTIFEQVLLVNSCVILASTLLAYWLTHDVAQPYHELLDTLFIMLASLLGVGLNALVLRRAFRPLSAMTTTIEQIQAGAREQRVDATTAPCDIAQVALAFNTMLDALEDQRQARLREITQAQEAERRRIALELHDATGQELTALLLRLEVIGQELAESPLALPRVQREVEATKALAERTLRGVQHLAQHLRPPVLDHMGLCAALDWLAGDLRVGTTLRWQCDLGPLPKMDALTETMLFRVAQEALSNALRHSGAATLHLTCTPSSSGVDLTIMDDGCGFDPIAAHVGMGLSSMRERMELVGGTLALTTHPGAGTTVCASVPLGGGQP